jgi:hypothetical protein
MKCNGKDFPLFKNHNMRRRRVSDTKDGRAAVEMGIDIATYRARIGGFGLRKKMDRGVQVKGQESSLTKTWFFGLVIAVLLVISGVEVNRGPQVERENRPNFSLC